MKLRKRPLEGLQRHCFQKEESQKELSGDASTIIWRVISLISKRKHLKVTWTSSLVSDTMLLSSLVSLQVLESSTKGGGSVQGSDDVDLAERECTNRSPIDLSLKNLLKNL